MTLRRPAAQRRGAPGWRRSGDESHWESLMSEGDLSPGASQPRRAPRPQSAIEGDQLEHWLEHLRTMQSKVRASVRDPSFSDRTASMPVLDKEPSRHAWRQMGFPSFSRDSSSCGSSSLCESSHDSQESLQTGLFFPPERRESWERAYILQAPRKEQAQLSYLTPVKIGWLPVQRRVMMVADASSQNPVLDHSAGQIKLKQPITPAFQRHQATPWDQDGEVERSHTSPSTLGVKTWQIPDQRSPVIKEVPEQLSSSVNEGDGPVGWQALRRGWTTNRVSAFPGGNKFNELPTGTNSYPNRKSPLMKTTSTQPVKHSPLQRTTSADPSIHPTLLQEAYVTDPYKPHTPLHRTSSVQPIKATAPLYKTNNNTESLHLQASSAVTTLIPQNKAGFSSITISSRKVSRSASLPGSNTSSQSSKSASPPLDNQPMDANSKRQVTVQRKATIIKVTEKRVISSPSPSTSKSRAETPPDSHALDTVVRRRKATIIKVTEHKESYSPSKLGSRHPEYRHSYTEGAYKENSTWSQGNHSENNATPSYHYLNSMPHSAITPKTFTSNADKHSTLHKSTLNLFVSSSPVIAAPISQEVSPKAVGQTSDRPQRPLSCYGNLIGYAEPSEDNVAQTAARKWSFELPRETNISLVNSNSSFISPEKAVKEAGQLMVDTLKQTRDEQKKLPPSVDGMRRASPSLTLIKAPDPCSHQSQEEVLAHNVAAIIANIKLQRKLSKKKTSSDNSEKDSAASPQGNTDKSKYTKPVSEQSKVQLHKQSSAETISLQQALERSRPDFIICSQERVRELERKVQERRERSCSRERPAGAVLRQRGTRFTSLNGNLYRPRDKAISRKEMLSRSKNPLMDVKRKNDEEKKREVCLSNRQRVELFKKKLLAQILHRSSN
ncbi:(E2-independent) E3 ubiquitin-conjugating enzyme FATS [Melanotaenia boesemani]|uniref:(E2-independent) E3 ubiquitin-conjugating enzyme FATS n=1 Tax=Melanotaenia boesemani TaxID=1250792 RepID=UPI001C0541A6|nr:(E2-independent) E3 ubiquitin-conjugating enzyme FATS [Melanotaenia boesemani]